LLPTFGAWLGANWKPFVQDDPCGQHGSAAAVGAVGRITVRASREDQRRTLLGKGGAKPAAISNELLAAEQARIVERVEVQEETLELRIRARPALLDWVSKHV
jgi:hypothetical protein